MRTSRHDHAGDSEPTALRRARQRLNQLNSVWFEAQIDACHDAFAARRAGQIELDVKNMVTTVALLSVAHRYGVDIDNPCTRLRLALDPSMRRRVRERLLTEWFGNPTIRAQRAARLRQQCKALARMSLKQFQECYPATIAKESSNQTKERKETLCRHCADQARLLSGSLSLRECVARCESMRRRGAQDLVMTLVRAGVPPMALNVADFSEFTGTMTWGFGNLGLPLVQDHGVSRRYVSGATVVEIVATQALREYVGELPIGKAAARSQVSPFHGGHDLILIGTQEQMACMYERIAEIYAREIERAEA